MKKLFLFITITTFSSFIFANNLSTKNSVDNKSFNEVYSAGYIIYETVEINALDITLPLEITIPLPPTGTVIGISGPVEPYNTNWSISNGTITITYTREDQVSEIRYGGKFYIEVATDPMPSPSNGYAVELKVNR